MTAATRICCLLVLALIVHGCGKPVAKRDDKSVAEASAGAQASDGSDPSVSTETTETTEAAEAAEVAAATPSNARPTAAISRRQLEAPDGTPYELRRARLVPLPVKARGVFFGDTKSSGTTVIVGVGRGQHTGLQGWHLVDLAAGKTLVKFGSSWTGSRVSNMAIAAAGKGPDAKQALLHMADGRLIEPRPQLGNGKPAVKWRIVVDERSPAVWLFANDGDGNTFHGQWRDTSQATVPVKDAFPFWPAMASGKSGIIVGNATTRTTCSRYHMRPSQEPKCRPGTWRGASSEPLGDDWTLQPNNLRYSLLRNDTSGEEVTLLADCEGLGNTTLIDPVRVLAFCKVGSDRARFHLWSPEGSWEWEASLTIEANHMNKASRPIAGLETIGKFEVPISRWVDLERAVLWQFEPVVPIFLAGAFGYDRRVLAHPVSNPRQLWLLDLDRGIVELVMDDVDCDGTLQQDDLLGQRVFVSCIGKQALADIFNNNKRFRHYKWSEVIDVSQRTRWRTTVAFEGRLSDAGLAAAIMRKKPVQLVAVETP